MFHMAFHETSRTPLLRAHHAGRVAARGGQLADRLAQLPELSQPVDVPSFPSPVVHIPGASLQQSSDQPAPSSEHFVALPSCSRGSHYPPQGLAGANIGKIALWNEKNVDNGPSRGGCFHNSPN